LTVLLERRWPSPRLLEFLYWKIIGSYQLMGLREGLRQYGQQRSGGSPTTGGAVWRPAPAPGAPTGPGREPPDVSIVIVNYNTRELTAQCIDSILANRPQASFEIVVVDNASSDGSADWLEARYPHIRLVCSSRNLGVAGGNNLGIRAAQGHYVLLLNSDAFVLPGMIDRVVEFLDTHPEAAGVGGNLINADGTFQAGFVDFPSLWQEFLIVTRLGRLLRPWYPAHGPCPETRQVDWMSTAFMLFRREAIEQVGFVDERYFLYSDETDLQYRLKQAGWQIYYLPDLNTVHLGGRSSTSWRRRPMVYRGKLLFFCKHYGPLRTMALRLMFVAASGLKIPFWLLAYLLPGQRQRARQELASHRAILRLCLSPQEALWSYDPD